MFSIFFASKYLTNARFYRNIVKKGVFEMNRSVESYLGNKEIFSENLIRYLDSSGKRQIEVANAIGVSSGTFCDWVKGRAYPRMDKVQKLADYFGISKSDLVEKRDIEKEKTLLEDQKILDLFHKVPKEKRAEAIALCESVLSTFSKF